MKKKICISGSMKFRDIIKQTMAKFEELGFEALFPNIDYTLETNDIVMSIEESKRLANDHYQAIRTADGCYFILPKGYIGTSCKLELGYAVALGKPIYFSELTNDVGLDCYPKRIISLENLGELIKEF